MSSIPIQDLEGVFSGYLRHDDEKNQFIKTLIKQVTQYERERQEFSRHQEIILECKEQIRKLDRLVNKDSYVAVLVDGDGAKFQDSLLRDPERGAQEAALNIKREVRRYLKNTPFESEDVPIVVRIFANVSGLGKSLRVSNIINSDNDMNIFAECFTNSQPEFDFINVGPGKENADSKMRKMFSHFYRNFQCKKIFFAGCHDNGYVHLLRELMGNADAESRIVLLETTPAELPFHTLTLPIIKFPSVFRSEPLGNEKKRSSPVISTRTSSMVPEPYKLVRASTIASFEPTTPSSASSIMPSYPPPPPIGSSPSNSTSNSPRITAARLAAAEIAAKQAQTISVSANGGTSVHYPRTYANVGGSSNTNINLQQTAKAEKARMISFNRDHYRIDPPNKNNPNVADSISYKSKRDASATGFCNNFYLNGGCERKNCFMEHDVELTKGEIAIHRFKARTSPCPGGPTCHNYDCYLSHHCPFGVGCTSASCKFRTTAFGDLHLSEKELEAVKIFVDGQAYPANL